MVEASQMVSNSVTNLDCIQEELGPLEPGKKGPPKMRANAEVATVPGSIPASSDTADGSEGRQETDGAVMNYR